MPLISPGFIRFCNVFLTHVSFNQQSTFCKCLGSQLSEEAPRLM